MTIQFMRLGTPICHCRPREFQERHLSSVDIGGLKESVFHDQQRIAATVKESQCIRQQEAKTGRERGHPSPSDLLITGLPWVSPLQLNVFPTQLGLSGKPSPIALLQKRPICEPIPILSKLTMELFITEFQIKPLHTQIILLEERALSQFRLLVIDERLW